MDFLDEYMAQASELVGDRTPDEIAYDDAIIKELRKGRPIKKALQIAGNQWGQIFTVDKLNSVQEINGVKSLPLTNSIQYAKNCNYYDTTFTHTISWSRLSCDMQRK